MRRASFCVAIAAVLATVALVPGFAPAGHCRDVFILSGTDQGQGNPRPGVNIGSVGCMSEAAHQNTNLTTLGATHLWGGALRTGADGLPVNPSGGTITMGGQIRTLTWFLETVRGRWETQSLGIPANATTIVMTVTFSGGRANQTVIYTRTA